MTRADKNFHTIAGKSVVEREDPIYAEYRRKWNEWPETYQVGEFPLHLDVESTNLCNLKCSFCENTYNKYRYGRMSEKIWNKIVTESGENNLNSLKFNLRGEPLLHKSLPRMVKEAKEAGILDVFFNTNATLLNESTCRKLIDANLDRISISFEGYEKTVYEKYRVGARFEEVVNNIRRLKELKEEYGIQKPLVRIQTVLVPDVVGKENEYSKFWLSLADEVAYLDMRNEENNPNHMGIRYGWACPRLWQRMSITWDGNIIPCVQDIFEKMCLGNVLDVKIKDAWNSTQQQDYRNLHKTGRAHQIAACDRCSFRANEISKITKCL